MAFSLAVQVAFVAELAVVARLATGPAARYPWFASMMTAAFLTHLLSRFVSPSTYLDLWVTTTPALIALQILAALELYGAWARPWTRAGHYFVPAAAGSSVLLIWSALPPRWNLAAWLVEIQRDLALVLAMTAIVTVVLFWGGRGVASRDLRIHTLVMVAAWSVMAVGWWWPTVWPATRPYVNDVSAWLRAGLFVWWSWGVRLEALPALPPVDDAAAGQEFAAIESLRQIRP